MFLAAAYDFHSNLRQLLVTSRREFGYNVLFNNFTHNTPGSATPVPARDVTQIDKYQLTPMDPRDGVSRPVDHRAVHRAGR